MKKRSYAIDFSAVELVHDYGIDVPMREIYLTGRDEYVFGAGGEGEAVEEPGVEYAMANQFIKNIRVLQNISDDPILVHMKTNGGYVGEGLAIYDAIMACPNRVTILSYIHARSMSSYIFQAADRRVMMPHSTFMFHRGTIGFDGTITQFESEHDEQARVENLLDRIYIDALKDSSHFKSSTEKEIMTWLRDQMRRREDVYMSAAQAVDYNFADYIFDGDWARLRAF